MKVVINKCYGGYGLSKAAYKFLRKKWDGYGFAFFEDRVNPKLVKCVEALGEEADGDCAKLKVVEIPDGVDFEIKEHDGFEHIAETHRTWA
jgi:hypothetical protein